MSRVPVTIITGPLGSGKTTLLRHLLDQTSRRIAIVMNEFGEIAIDSRIVEGKNVRMAELGGGCVCCSLLGEFEAAVAEIIATVDPELMVVETTGLAEPDALVFDIEENLAQIRLDGVITILDADAWVRFPSLSRTTRIQIEAADLILLNKTDLVSAQQVQQIEQQLNGMVSVPILLTRECRVDPDLLFGIGRDREVVFPRHLHQPEFESFHFQSRAVFRRNCFEDFAAALSPAVYRAKGFVRLTEGSRLFNFVAGRWQLEPFEADETVLVFIGSRPLNARSRILADLKRCEYSGEVQK